MSLLTEHRLQFRHGIHCTFNVIVVECCNVPLLALMVTVLLPAGVPLTCGELGLLPPAQASNTIDRPITAIGTRIFKPRRARVNRRRETEPKRNPGDTNAKKNRRCDEAGRESAVAAVVVMFSVTWPVLLTAPKVQALSAGNPEHFQPETAWALKPP